MQMISALIAIYFMGIPSGPVLFDGFNCLKCVNMSDFIINPLSNKRSAAKNIS